MKDFIEELTSTIQSEVQYDRISRLLYSTDASIYEIEPVCVVIPRNKEDLQKTILIAYKHKVPIIPRGAGTGISGGCLGKGVVIDTSKHLNRIIEITPQSARIEPGVIQDDLNAACAPLGMRLGPDTSTGNRATVGGMLSNNAAGAHSLRYGKMQDRVLEVELILYDGSIVLLKPIQIEELSKQQGALRPIYSKIYDLKKEYEKEIVEHFPKLHRRASGYSLDELVKGTSINPARLIAGAEGTLGFVSEITIALDPVPLLRGLVVFEAENLYHALDDLPKILEFSPFSVELIDEKIIKASRKSDSLSFLGPLTFSLIVIEIEDATWDAVKERSLKVLSFLVKKQYVKQISCVTEAHEQESIWNIRKAGLGLLLSRRSYSRAIAFIEDIAVEPERVSFFLQEFHEILKRYKTDAGIYGHIGPGCLHIRPYIDTRSEHERAVMKDIMKEVVDLVKKCSGVLSGEHGDGLVRSWTTEEMFGTKLNQAFIQLKEAFDPEYLMNPGKIVPSPNIPLQSLTDNLRLTQDPKPDVIDPFLDFSREGGLALSVDLCNGNGQCRKKEGVMCPSFQATHDEKDTTRARANALRGILFGTLAPESLFSEELYDVMDLCIQCKGCKTECPSNVDMAKMKSEYLYQYQSKKGIPFRSRVFAHLGTFFRFGSVFPTFVNWLSSTRPAKAILSSIGISPERVLPRLAKVPFTKSLPFEPISTPDVVLFIDTFTEFICPEIGRAALKVLKHLGFSVKIVKKACCGRTFISKGMLQDAKNKAHKLIDILYPYAEKNIPIIGLEPSCLLTLRDEFKNYFLDKEKVEAIANNAFLFDEFIEKHKDRLHLMPFDRPILIHTHCHQKALLPSQSTLALLKACHLDCCEIPSGCCGMAGSFGYEKEHYFLSQKIANLILFPTILSNKEAIIVANGISCRTQIQEGLNIPTLHLAELLIQLVK